MPSATRAPANTLDPAIVSPEGRRAAIERFHAAGSGRDKPSRYWRANVDGIDIDALHVQPGAVTVRLSGVPPRAIGCDLVTAFRDHRELVERAFGKAIAGGGKWAQLGTAFAHDGAFIYVPAETASDAPVEIDLSVEDAGAAFAYILVLADPGASLQVVERLRAPRAALIGVTVEIVCAEAARVQYSNVQAAGMQTKVCATRAARPGKDGSVSLNTAELGAELTVSDIAVSMNEPGAATEIATLFFPSGSQHVDVVSSADHHVGETTSSTIVKSAATGAGQARYLGNIRIAAHAQGSNAALRDDALLLGKHAHIDSIPALEIAANDVKAYHGATVGAIDEDALFYMTTRGIERDAAGRMIALGFFEPVIERFPGEALREELRVAIAAKVEAAP